MVAIDACVKLLPMYIDSLDLKTKKITTMSADICSGRVSATSTLSIPWKHE